MDPHVLIFPLPLQGPINYKLKLAELFCLAGFHVTFLNTEHMHRCLLRHTDVQSRFSLFPNFKFETVSDGLPKEHIRLGDGVMGMMDCMEAVTKPLFRDYLVDHNRGGGKVVTCVVVDGMYGWVPDVAEEIGIPFICFDTISPCAQWTYMCLPKLVAAGELPFKGKDLDVKITCVPGMENLLGRRDLPDFCRSNDLSGIQPYLKASQQIPRAQGVILNTYEDLDRHTLSQMRTVYPNVYAIGPLHAHLRRRIAPSPTHSNSLWVEDKSCLMWLNMQSFKSVIYVSIGSHASMSRAQFIEFWYGLVNSGHRFLWVRRPGSIIEKETKHQLNIATELLEGTKERGYIIEWAPQEEVLAHPAIGGFLTHSGWNSTLESIVEGVPMICSPYFMDQQVNSRFVSEVWKIGMDMKDTCDRVIIEEMVRSVMKDRKEEFRQSAQKMAKRARESISEGGSSYCDFNRV